MTTFIFIVYLLIFCWVITRISFFTKSGLNKYWLVGLFAIKIIAGCMYGWFYSQPAQYATSDTWKYFTYSRIETDLLLKNPAAFIKNLFTHSYSSSGNLFIAHNSYWNNLKDELLIKILAIVNVFTLKNYYANVVIFNFLFFFGCIAFYCLVKEKIIADKIILIAFVFCIPSFLFWCSGIHKDGFVFMCIALCSFYFNECLKQNKFLFKYVIAILFFALLLFALRNFVLLLLIPALFTWYMCNLFPTKKLLIALCIYTFIVVIFFTSGFVNPSLNFPAYIVNKQNEFKQLGGNSQLILPELIANFSSFVHFLPSAIDISLLRPHINELKNILYLPAIAENIFIYALIVYSFIIIYKRKNKQFDNSAKIFLIFCCVFALSNLLMMGYTITLTGAIVRYKSFVLPFIIAPLAAFVRIKNRLK